jgi:hypothetical protein
MRIGLVSCGKAKCDHAAPASDLYTSTLFRKVSAYAAESYDGWSILSAKHHLLEPAQVIAPYDLSLKELGTAQRKVWATQVCRQLRERYPPDGASRPEFYLHAGAGYRQLLVDYLHEHGYAVHVPLVGLGIGQQLQWYTVRGY